MSPRAQRRLGAILWSSFLLALVIATGPGVLLVNRPEIAELPGGLRLPVLYVWALGWYFVEAGLVLALYLFVWRPEEGGGKDGRPDSRSD